MKKVIRIISLALALLFVFGLLPIGEFSLVETTEAATGITTEAVTKKIDEIWKQIGNDNKQYYWNMHL